MIERIEEMPEGTTGLRATRKLDKNDYVTVVEPMHMFGWLTPGALLVRDLNGLEEAKPGSRPPLTRADRDDAERRARRAAARPVDDRRLRASW
jgi:hypothetical protein